MKSANVKYGLLLIMLLALLVMAQEDIELPDSLTIDTLSYDYDTTFVKDLSAHLTDMFAPVNISELNSPVNDFAPYISLAGDKLYFSSSREGGYGGDDIWYSYIGPRRHSAPINMGKPINSEFNEGSISFSPDGRFAYFTSCGRPDSYGGCDIYRSEFREGEWQTPRNLGRNINSRYWDGHPYISADGLWLYFSSERLGGYGGRDIYRAPIIDGVVGKAQNLENPINNARNQVSPALHPDGKTLYFASDGHGGFGGLDIFKSEMDEMGRWSQPINLGEPINTTGNDYFFAVPVSGDFIYFASSRPGGYGGTDLYTYPLEAELRPEVVATLRGRVIDQATGEPIEANVQVEDILTTEILYDRLTDPTTGEFIVVLPAGRNYGISVSAEDYLFASQSYEVEAKEGYHELEQIFELTRIETGATVSLNNLFFYFGTAELRPESYPELSRVVDVMNRYPDMQIEIQGYTDTIGAPEFNQWLSEERAKAVADYVVENGIEKSRITSKGFGEMLADEFRLARRVEFKIITVSEGVRPRIPRQEPDTRIQETIPQDDEQDIKDKAIESPQNQQ